MNPEELAKQLGGMIVQPEEMGDLDASTPSGIEGFAESLGGKMTPGQNGAMFNYLTGKENQVEQGQINFLERLKLSFGGKEALERRKQIETEAGLRGRLDIGDLADVVGSLLPSIGAVLGG